MNLKEYNEPNFFMSPRFVEVIKANEELDDEMRYSDGLYFFPPPNKKVKCYIDFEGYKGKGKKKFHDNEYIYSANDIIGMKGRRFKVFRHNVNKFGRENPDIEYKTGSFVDAVSIFIKWLEGRDTEILSDYVTNGMNLQRKIVYLYGEPIAFNLWDIGYKYIHYIACYYKDMKYLNEYTRWLFYKDMKDKFVHDGSDLGLESLKRFKMKLNPIIVRPRFSWGV